MSMSHIPCGMWSFMRHALASQCLTPYAGHISYSMRNAKLYASCTISMSNIVYACHVSYSMWPMCFMRHAASILSHSKWNASFYASFTTISMSNTVFKSHIRCGMWSFVSHAPSECLTPYVMSHSMSNLKLYASYTTSVSNTDRLSCLIIIPC